LKERRYRPAPYLGAPSSPRSAPSPRGHLEPARWVQLSLGNPRTILLLRRVSPRLACPPPHLALEAGPLQHVGLVPPPSEARPAGSCQYPSCQPRWCRRAQVAGPSSRNLHASRGTVPGPTRLVRRPREVPWGGLWPLRLGRQPGSLRPRSRAQWSRLDADPRL